MNKIARLEKILDVVKAQEELGLAKAKSIIGDVKRKSDDFPDLPIPEPHLRQAGKGKPRSAPRPVKAAPLPRRLSRKPFPDQRDSGI